MRKARNIFKRRKFKRISSRSLSIRDITVLEFLWTWKVASHAMLALVAFKNKSSWWAYKALRQLKDERYIQLLPRGKYIDQELWALTELGFEIVLQDRDDIDHHRYKPHAPAHDYLSTCLQLGDVWLSKTDCRYFTEQMLASLSPVNFPKAFRSESGHVPDGLTLFRNPLREVIVGYEVDLNLKSEERYQNAFKYLEGGVKPNLVVWLVRNQWIADRISQCYQNFDRSQKSQDFLTRYAFVLLDDFKQNVWGAKVIIGPMKDLSIRKLHANLLQIPGKEAPSFGQTNMNLIFFQKYRSPQKSKTYLKGADP